jgi:hypothetical protein
MKPKRIRAIKSFFQSSDSFTEVSTYGKVFIGKPKKGIST